MKHIYLLFLFLIGQSIWAQNSSLNYKALLTDNGSAIQNQNVNVKFSILENGTTLIYQETHQTTTDGNGIIVLHIGEGTTTDDFTLINWENAQFLKVEIDTGSGYQDFGTTAFSSVPYAKYADKAGNVFSGNFTDLSNVPSGLSDGDDDTHLTETQVDNFVANNGYLTQVDNIQGIPVSNTTPNNGQVLKFNGTQFVPADDDVSGGSGTDGVVNSAAFSGTATKTLTLARSNGLGNITANFTDNDTHLTDANIGAMGYIKNADDADADATNELQTISKTGNTVTLSNGGGSFTDADTHLTETQVDNFVANNGYLTSEVDASVTNELQTMSVSGNQLTISDGNTVTLPTGSGGDQWGSQVVDTDLTLVGEGIPSNPLGVDANAAIFSAWDKNASDDFDGEFTSLNNIPSGLSDGDDDTQLTETQVDNFVANNGYLTSEVDGDTTNELQTISKVGNTVTLSNGGGSFTDTDTDTQLTETQVDNFVANNGYLTSEVDASITNELQTLSITGDQLSISDGNTITLPSGSGGSDQDFLVVGTGASPTNNSDNIYHEGNISVGHDGASNAKIHIENIDSDIDDYENTGIYIRNNNKSTTDKIGVKLEMEAPSTNNTAIVYGVKNNILDNGDSDIYGEYTSIGGLNGDGNHYGVYYYMNGDGIGLHTGSKAYMLTNGTAEQIGFDADIYTSAPSNNATQTGVKTHIYGQGTGVKYAVNNLIDGDAEGYIFGVKNEISNTANGKQYGIYNKMSGTGTNKHYGAYTKISGTGSGQQIGYTTNNYNSGNGAHYGAHNFIYGSGSGEHIGVKNEMSGAGTGNQIGVRNMINNTNGTNQYGVYTTLDATSGNGDRFATRNDLFGAGDGNLYGVRNQVSNSGSGVHSGTYNNIYGTGNGTHYGTRNALSGSGNGTHYGTKNVLSGSGTGVQYGNHTIIDNSTHAEHVGTYAQLTGDGLGAQYGSKIIIDNTGEGDHIGNSVEISGGTYGEQYGSKTTINTSGNANGNYGNYIAITGTGSSVRYGNYITMTGSGNNLHYGSYVKIDEDDNHKKYGFYSDVSGAGNESKLGVYAVIDPAANGNHYAIYGRATRNTDNTYAGYFYGDAKVTGKLKSSESGNADMKAYIYGQVNADGTIVTDASSDGFTVNKIGTGEYQIHFDISMPTATCYIVVSSIVDDAVAIANPRQRYADHVYIQVRNLLGNLKNKNFSFVIYKK